jgi:hypothetical protein
MMCVIHVQTSIIIIQKISQTKDSKRTIFCTQIHHVINIRSISRSGHRGVICSEKQRKMQKEDAARNEKQKSSIDDSRSSLPKHRRGNIREKAHRQKSKGNNMQVVLSAQVESPTFPRDPAMATNRPIIILNIGRSSPRTINTRHGRRIDNDSHSRGNRYRA